MFIANFLAIKFIKNFQFLTYLKKMQNFLYCICFSLQSKIKLKFSLIEFVP